MGYDIIGDVHGQAGKLEELLKRMGYEHRSGAWRHPDRTAIFVGDFVDRGPRQLDTVEIVRAMVGEGSALAVMGNHELNAIGWITPRRDEPSLYLRRRDGKKGQSNHHHHKEFLHQIGADTPLHKDVVAWFMSLPLWLDLPELCVAHACWHKDSIAQIKSRLGGAHLTEDFLHEALCEEAIGERNPDSRSLFEAVELVCKGVEIALPGGVSYKDQDGFERSKVRSRWWDQEAHSFKQCALLPSALKSQLPDELIPESAKIRLPQDRPVFFGHYWMGGEPAPVAASAACVDYSAAKNGPLVAYRHDGEFELSAAKFASSDLHPAPRPKVI